MDTGNNTAGKTAPERYVSEKAFEELPDTFQKLAELLGEDQFELVAVNDEKDPQDQKAASESAFSEAIAEKSDDNMYRVDSYVKNGEIRLVYLMNDAVESFLVFGNARMTGVYKPDYEGEILADLSRQGREYILVVHQDDSVVTLFFETLSRLKSNGRPGSPPPPHRAFEGHCGSRHRLCRGRCFCAWAPPIPGHRPRPTARGPGLPVPRW